jgi:hypothetical protein
MKYARIEFLETTHGNDMGDIVRVVGETEGEVYYWDGYRRYCYLFKSEEGTTYRYIPKGERSNAARRHHNNKGLRQIKRGTHKIVIKKLAKELKIPYKP